MSTIKKPASKPTPKSATALQAASNSSVVVGSQVPDYIVSGPGRGSENVTADDLIIPRLEIVQGLSPAVKRGDPGYIDGAQPGMFTNSVTRELYGDHVTVIPIHFSMQFLVWRDRQLAREKKINAEGGFFGSYSSLDEAQARAEQEGGEGQAIVVIDTPTHLCLLINPLEGGPVEVMIPMPKTKAKVSRQWNSLIRLAGGDRFSRAYDLTAVLQKNDKGDFYNYSVRLLGFPSKSVYDKAEELYESVAQGRSRTMDMSDVSDEGADSAEM